MSSEDSAKAAFQAYRDLEMIAAGARRKEQAASRDRKCMWLGASCSRLGHDRKGQRNRVFSLARYSGRVLG